MAVFCGSSTGFSEEYARRAEELGRYLARSGIGMVYGGGKIGLMGAIADAIIDEGGEVIGVIPGLLRHEEVAHSRVERMLSYILFFSSFFSSNHFSFSPLSLPITHFSSILSVFIFQLVAFPIHVFP